MADNYRIEVTPVLKQGEVQKALDKESKNAGKSGATLGNSFVTQFKSAIGRRLSYAVLDALKDAVSNVLELNKAQTELKKVSDLAGDALDKYTQKAAEAGKAVGRSAAEMVSAATEFKKAGATESEALVLAGVATKFQNIADAEISAADAAKFINSQMKAFNITANDAESIIDKVNET